MKRLLLLLAMMLVFPLAVADPPQPDCSEDETSPLKPCEEKLNAAQGILLDELNLFVDELDRFIPEMDLPTKSMMQSQSAKKKTIKDHIAKMQDEQLRAAEMIQDSEETDFDEMIAQGGKEKGQKCAWEEAEEVINHPEYYLPDGLYIEPDSGLGDGDCDQFHAKDEITDDPVTIRERSQPNICVRVCKDKWEVDGQPPGQLKKDKIKTRHVKRKIEAIDTTIDATDTIAKAREDLMARNALKNTSASASALADSLPECNAGDKGVQQDAWIAKQVLVPVLLVAKIASRITEGIAQTAEKTCLQTIFGANTAAACIPAVIADQIAKAAVDAIEFGIQQTDLIIEYQDYFSANETFDCAHAIKLEQEKIFGLVSGMDGIIRDINAKAGNTASGIIELKRLVMENREYILNNRMILLTPHGRRDELALYEAPPPPPAIVSVEGETGSSTLTVKFTEGVWTEIGQSGALEAGDFVLTDNALSDPEIITAVTHSAGTDTATLSLNKPLDGDEFGVDALSAKADAIFNEFDIPMDDSIEKYVE